jgi:DNA-binding transcriptional regulator GbsR (MarR family)
MSDLDDVRDELVRLWGGLAQFWGVSAAAGRVFGLAMSSSRALTADDIVDRLGMSRSAVSMATKELRDWGLLLVERSAGARTLAYAPETDLEKAVRNIVKTRKRREWDPLLEHLREWIPRLEKEKGAEAAALRDRLRGIEALVGMADSMAESFLRGGVVQPLGLKVLAAAARRRLGATRRKP